MQATADTIFSFSPEELPRLADVWRLLPALSLTPQDFDEEQFLSQIQSDPGLVGERNGMDAQPDEDHLLHAEFVASRRKRRRTAELGTAGGKTYSQQRGTLFLGANPSRLGDLSAAVNVALGAACPIQGDFFYPAMGFRGWHTNAYDRPGWRMYLVSTDSAGASSFRIWDEKQRRIVDVYDSLMSVNFFRLHPRYLLWHAVVSYGARRWSQGFAVPPDWARRVGVG